MLVFGLVKIATMRRKYFRRLLVFTLILIVLSEIIQHFDLSSFSLVEKMLRRGKLFDNASHKAQYGSPTIKNAQDNEAAPLELPEDTRVIRKLENERKVPAISSVQQDAASPNTFRKINNGSFVYSAYFDDRSDISAVVRIFGVSDDVTKVNPPMCTLRLNDNSYQVIQSRVTRLEPRKNLGFEAFL